MKIKIAEVKAVDIDAVLSEINGKAVSHTASHHEVFKLAAANEKTIKC